MLDLSLCICMWPDKFYCSTDHSVSCKPGEHMVRSTCRSIKSTVLSVTVIAKYLDIVLFYCCPFVAILIALQVWQTASIACRLWIF
jgi:hypothetical protein